MSDSLSFHIGKKNNPRTTPHPKKTKTKTKLVEQYRQRRTLLTCILLITESTGVGLDPFLPPNLNSSFNSTIILQL